MPIYGFDNLESSRFLTAIKDPVAGSTVRLRKCDRTSGEQIWVYETFVKRFLLYSQSYFSALLDAVF